MFDLAYFQVCYSNINPDQFETDVDQHGGPANILGPEGKKMLGLTDEVGEDAEA